MTGQRTGISLVSLISAWILHRIGSGSKLVLLSISTANTADLLLWKSYYVFCFQKMPYIPIISNQSSFITSRRIEMMLFIVKLWIIVCMGVCVCASLSIRVHQGCAVFEERRWILMTVDPFSNLFMSPCEHHPISILLMWIKSPRRARLKCFALFVVVVVCFQGDAGLQGDKGEKVRAC